MVKKLQHFLSTRSKLFWSLVVSLSIHLLWLPIPVTKILSWDTSPPSKEENVIRLKLRSDQDKKQIVNFTDHENETEEKETDFVSKEDRFFEEESVAKKVDTFKDAGKGFRDGKERAKDQENIKTTQNKQKRQNQKSESQQKKSFKMSDLGVNPRSKFLKENTAAQQMKALGVESGKEGETGLAQNNDFVEDLPLGDVTKFNTKEYKYYGFYHRIRQRLEQHWGSSLQEKVSKLHRSGGRFPASENMITALRVTMDKRGNILDVKVKSTSGMSELDDAAIESFNKAGPFPNPPQGMAVNGVIQIEWGFVVKS